jgi:hypothetical protein
MGSNSLLVVDRPSPTKLAIGPNKLLVAFLITIMPVIAFLLLARGARISIYRSLLAADMPSPTKLAIRPTNLLA